MAVSEEMKEGAVRFGRAWKEGQIGKEMKET